MAERLLTIAQAARETGLVYHTLRRLIARGRVASVRVAGLRKVRLSAVQAVLEEICATA